jgi:hypothetical protein
MFKSFCLESSNINLRQDFTKECFNYLKSYNIPKLGSLRMKYKNLFILPRAEMKKQKLDGFEFMKTSIGFSAEMRSLLIEEFLEANIIYLN